LVGYQNKGAIIRRILDGGIIPVIRADSAQMASRAITAIQNGGISVIEVTMTVPGAISVIEVMTDLLGDQAIVGAGTVRDKKTAQDCISAGARFIVCPVLELGVIECCVRMGVAVMPGALTPTEVFGAWTAGADLVKVFPAGAVGGASYIKALRAPLPEVLLVPTGGVSLETAADFIRAGAAALGVGTDLVDIEVLKNGQDHLISDRARQFAQIVREARASLGPVRDVNSTVVGP
jgi:2-dehydro-3-deoxyphosphogluconate aldolase/(4S)-4-hydroxy-2-oxoglutarate aldolase